MLKMTWTWLTLVVHLKQRFLVFPIFNYLRLGLSINRKIIKLIFYWTLYWKPQKVRSWRAPTHVSPSKFFYWSLPKTFIGIQIKTKYRILFASNIHAVLIDNNSKVFIIMMFNFQVLLIFFVTRVKFQK